jgi:hypothetical protein
MSPLKVMILSFLPFLIVATVFTAPVQAQNFNRIGLEPEPTSFVFLSAAPIFSQMNLKTTTSAGYNGWGYHLIAGFQFGALEPLITRLHLAYQNISLDNNQNSTTNRESTTSNSFEMGACVLIFSRACIGGGVQKRELTLSQINGSTVTNRELNGWTPYARATFDLLDENTPYTLAPSVAYHFGSVSGTELSALQFGLQIGVRIVTK